MSLRLVLSFLLIVVAADVAHGEANPLVRQVLFEGVKEGSLLDALKASSETLIRIDQTDTDFGQIMALARDDQKTFEKVLRSHGYYRPFVQIRVLRLPKNKEVALQFVITTGPLYRLQEVTLIWNVAHPIPDGVGLIGITSGEGVDASVIIGAQERLIHEVGEKGFPFAKVDRREITIDHASRTGVLVYRIDQGPLATFGPTTYYGTEGIDTPYLSHRIPWEEGEPFRLSALEEVRKRFEATSLFSRVKVQHGERVDNRGRLQVNIHAVQRLPRTVSAGVYYRSDDKLGVKAAWEHRNFTGRGDRLKIESDVSAIRREGAFRYRLPEVFDPRLSLNLTGIAADDTTVAYTSRYQDGSATLDARALPWLTVGLGGGVRRGETTTKATDHSFNYLLGYGIGFATIDQTDTPLDPRWGLRVSGWAEPYYGESEGDISFLKAQGNADIYATYDASTWSVTLAARGELGALFGAEFERVPPDLRYYAGGAGSIRGYPYQTIGPEINGIPTGGRSVLAGSVESRFRFGPAWGGVIFFDGGSAYAGETPDYTIAPLFGAGIGIRYMTGFGPIRFDVALPLSRRESDPPFQIYVGLGQAF